MQILNNGTSWGYRFDTARVNGKRKQTSKYGFKTKKEAERAGAEALAKYYHSGRINKPSEMSFADLTTEWLETYCPMQYEQTTIDNYEKVSRLHIVPIIGAYRISSLLAPTFQDVINTKFEENYSMNRLSTIKSVMSKIMQYAVECSYIENNPVYNVHLPSRKVARRNPNTRKKQRTVIPKAIMQEIFERFPEGHNSHIPLMLGYKCGLRLGETYALTWDDIDLDNGYINVNHQVQYHDGWVMKAPKYDSNRVIPIDEQLISLLKRTRLNQRKNRFKYGPLYTNYYVDKYGRINTEDGEPIDLVNVSEDGHYNQPRQMQHTSGIIHGREKEDAIWSEFDYHSLRHTHATILAENGVTAKEIQLRLGHKGIETTLNIYTHGSEKLTEQTRSSLNKIFG